METTEELKTAFEHLVQAFSDHNLGVLSTLVHDNIVFLGVLSPVRAEGKPAFLHVFKNFFSLHDHILVTPLDPHFQIIDSIGLSWGSVLVELQPKGLEKKVLYLRYSCTFGYFANIWQLLSMHTSWLLRSEEGTL